MSKNAVVFRATRGKHDAIYAILYTSDESFADACCATGPTYTSLDGEYREWFINYADSIRIMMENPATFEPLELTALADMAQGKLEMRVDLIFGEGASIVSNAILARINNERMAIKLYILASYIARHADRQRHAVSTFYRLVLHHDTSDGEPFAELSQNAYGQKLTPIPMAAIDSVWNEAMLTKACSMLKTQGVAPCFAEYYTVFTVDNARAELFDGEAMRAKYENSRIAGELGDQIRRAKRGGGAIDASSVALGVQHAEMSLSMSTYATCMIVQNVGRTFLNWIWDATPTGVDYIAVAFEIIYGLCAMNIKYGLVHGDLHLNNACAILGNSSDTLFALDDHTWNIRSSLRAYIIDFSRSVQGIARAIEVAPSIIKHRTPELIEHIANAPKTTLIRVLSAIDVYVITSFMQKLGMQQGTIAPDVCATLGTIAGNAHTIAEELLTGRETYDGAWPTEIILKCHFEQYRTKEEDNIHDKSLQVWRISREEMKDDILRASSDSSAKQ